MRNNNIPLALVILLDIVFAGLGLIVFALFHHVIPQEGTSEALIINNTVYAAEEETQISEETVVQQTINNTFEDMFTDGEIIQTDNSYISEDMNITIEQVQENGVTYYVADIYINDYEDLLTAFAMDTYGKAFVDDTLDMAIENEAILAISGDYYGNGDDGLVIRNGVLYRDDVNSDVLIMYDDGSMETFSESEFDIDYVIENGAYQGWAFGPELLDDGELITDFDSNRRMISENPRCGIGYYEPGHYAFVVVDGRDEGYSVGMTLPEFSQLFYDLGCSSAYNLDGGKSAVMVFMNEVVNQPDKGGREISDIIYLK